MKNFKEIAEKCLAGELKGTFKNRKGENIPSEALFRSASKTYPYTYCISHCVTVCGNYYKSCKPSKYDIIDFIPDPMKEQIKIDIPEGKVPVMEQTEKGVVITWKEKELTYEDIVKTSNENFPYSYVRDLLSLTGQQAVQSSAKTNEDNFYKKVEVLRKLTNIRNYFGKSENDKGYGILYHKYYERYYVDIVGPFSPVHVCFSTKEQAEQAIKMLGDELKYLFEPW